MVNTTESKSATGQPFRFPTVQSASLDKHPVKLPQDFAGDHNLVIIAFQREQQKDVDTWLIQMKQFEAVDSGLRYYELPTIARLNVLARWFIDNGMRGGIPDHKQRERTITLYLDKEPFRTSLGIRSENQIYALLVDRAGNILWRTEGVFDEAKATSLKQTLERLNHAHSPERSVGSLLTSPRDATRADEFSLN